jgi:membrane-associated PAP2 superfamily phosphatase
MVGTQYRSLIVSTLSIGAALALIIAIALGTGFDRQVSDLFFDASAGRWLIDHDTSPLRLWFYDGPKALIILFGVGLLCIIARPALVPSRWITRREAAFVFTCLAVVPLVIGVIRNHSNVQCPVVLQQYGGSQSNDHAHVSLAGFLEPRRPGGCWPSGHASGGFALLCLAWLERRRITRCSLFAGAVTLGLAMGAYQLARGAHFASHVVATGLISALVIELLARLFKRPASNANVSTGH